MKNRHYIPILMLVAAMFAACKGPAPALENERFALYLTDKTARIEYRDGNAYAVRFDNVIVNEQGTKVYRWRQLSPITVTADGKVRICSECFEQVGYQQCLQNGHEERECAWLWNQENAEQPTTSLDKK